MNLFKIHQPVRQGESIDLAWINFVKRGNAKQLIFMIPLFHIEEYYDIVGDNLSEYAWCVPYLWFEKTNHSLLFRWGKHMLSDVK